MRQFIREMMGAVLVIALVCGALSLPFIITGEDASEYEPTMMPGTEMNR